MSIVTGKKVGSTNLTALYSDVQDNQALNVTAVSLYEIETIVPCTYDGTEKTPEPVVRVLLTNGEISPPLVKGTDYSVEYKNNVNVGTATVTVTGIGNYTGQLSMDWTINAADITVNVSDLGIITTYDGNNHASPLTSDNITVYGDQVYTVKYDIGDGTYTLDTCPEVVNVADSKFIFFQVTAPNHNATIGSYEVTINPKVISLTWGTSSWTYDGDEHSTTCTVGNLIGNDTCTVTLSNNSITNIGSTTVTATGLSNSNYELPSSGLTQTITINPGLFIKVSGTWTPVKKVYKKVSGSWVLQELSGSFNTDKLYMEK